MTKLQTPMLLTKKWLISCASKLCFVVFPFSQRLQLGECCSAHMRLKALLARWPGAHFSLCFSKLPVCSSNREVMMHEPYHSAATPSAVSRSERSALSACTSCGHVSQSPASAKCSGTVGPCLMHHLCRRFKLLSLSKLNAVVLHHVYTGCSEVC